MTMAEQAAGRRAGRPVRALGAAFAVAWRVHRWALAGLLLAATLGGLAPVTAAWLLRSVLDDLTASGQARPDTVVLAGLAAGMCLAGVLSGVLPAFSQYLAAQSARAVQRRTVLELFTAVTRMAGLRRLEDPAFQDELRFSQRAGSDGPGQVVSGAVSVVQSALTLAGFMATLVVLSPVLGGVVVAAAVPAFFLERGMAERQAAMLRGITHSQRRQFFYANLLTDVQAAKEIRVFGLGGFFRGRMIAELVAAQRASQRGDRRVLTVSAVLELAGTLVAGGGLLWAVLAARAGRLTLGDVAMLVAALGAASSSLTVIISTAARTYQSVLMFGSYLELIATPPDLPVPAAPAVATPLRHGIEVADVWFRYGPDKPWVLRGVSCFIPHGQALALVGYNGAGKSTLVKLLCRFYDPDRGRILWDGTDMRDMDPDELRDRISVVFQDYMTYELSAADNIGVGDLTKIGEPAALTAAACAAGIDEKLAGLPKGYQTLLTRTFFDLADRDNPETGVLLSGGQWQRVALARAFLRGARDLMILDEPSSGLDAEAEHDISVRLRHSRRGRTTVLISHRLGTVRAADHIVVLADGAVIEQGDHDALMTMGGTYARLFSLQARGYAESNHD
jgi:ATP-binding cassette, subfamily B, bacterial